MYACISYMEEMDFKPLNLLDPWPKQKHHVEEVAVHHRCRRTQLPVLVRNNMDPTSISLRNIMGRYYT